ncbi:MAG: tetratricopeptide repeat protein, partial [Geitlerinemataceae cyanobacterium]
QSLEIFRQIGDRSGEASSLKNLAYALAKLDRPWEALQHFQKARQLYAKLELEHEVQDCDAVIYRLHSIIPAITHPSPTIDPEPRPRRRRSLWVRLKRWFRRL